MQKYILKTSQLRVHSYHILKISEILASMLLCNKEEHEFNFELSLKLGLNIALFTTVQILLTGLNNRNSTCRNIFLCLYIPYDYSY